MGPDFFDFFLIGEDESGFEWELCYMLVFAMGCIMGLWLG